MPIAAGTWPGANRSISSWACPLLAAMRNSSEHYTPEQDLLGGPCKLHRRPLLSLKNSQFGKQLLRPSTFFLLSFANVDNINMALLSRR
jgi:hypothetical protein